MNYRSSIEKIILDATIIPNSIIEIIILYVHHEIKFNKSMIIPTVENKWNYGFIGNIKLKFYYYLPSKKYWSMKEGNYIYEHDLIEDKIVQKYHMEHLNLDTIYTYDGKIYQTSYVNSYIHTWTLDEKLNKSKMKISFTANLFRNKPEYFKVNNHLVFIINNAWYVVNVVTQNIINFEPPLKDITIINSHFTEETLYVAYHNKDEEGKNRILVYNIVSLTIQKSFELQEFMTNVHGICCIYDVIYLIISSNRNYDERLDNIKEKKYISRTHKLISVNNNSITFESQLDSDITELRYKIINIDNNIFIFGESHKTKTRWFTL